MKKKLVITAAITAALMAAGAVGGTIAYFTSEANTTASIEAGVVRMSMEAKNLKLYSLDAEQTGTFENGGTAELVDSTLTLAKMTPGDKVEFDLVLANHSNVLAKYQVLHAFGNEQKGVEVDPELTYATAKLSSGLVISMKDAATDQEAPVAMTQIAPGADMPTYHVSVELPAEAGNEFQGAKSDVVFQLYGIQANKPLDSALVLTYDQLDAALAANQKVELLADIEMPADQTIVLPEGAHIVGNGHKIVAEGRTDNPFIFKLGGDNVVIEGIELESPDASANVVIVPYTHGFTLKDCEFHGATNAGVTSYYLVYNYGQPRIAQNIVFDGVTVDGYWANLYGGNVNLDDDHDIIVRNSTINTETYTFNAHCRNLIVEDSVIRGWTTFDNAGTAQFTNVTFKATDYYSGTDRYNYLRCYSDVVFTNCRFLEDGEHSEGDGEGLKLEVVYGAVATLTNCQVARKNALNTFIDIVATDVTTFNFVTLRYNGSEDTSLMGAKVVVNGVDFLAADFPQF